jgi:hypothetical protein
MRSSISSSNPSALGYAKALFGICLILVIGLEILSNYLLKHDSITYHRVSRQYADALESHRAKPGEPASVLMVGNSLLLEGIDVDRLQTLTSSGLRIYPIFLEGTGYYDWLYGLRRLFRQGARPQVVVLGLEANSFLSKGVRQEYCPMMFFDSQDVLGVAFDLGLDRTATSNLLLAHSSTFWDTRSVIRMQILRRIIPHFQDLFMLVKAKRSVPQDPEFETAATSRLLELRELCGAYGAKLIILIPPTPSSERAIRQMTIASKKVGVETLVPIDPTALSARFYQTDATHLNPEGAALFTSALVTGLPTKILVAQTTASPN